jgi:hypothetical protein
MGHYTYDRRTAATTDPDWEALENDLELNLGDLRKAGGRHGTPGIATEANTVKVTRSGR